jgi:hypothetical protein
MAKPMKAMVNRVRILLRISYPILDGPDPNSNFLDIVTQGNYEDRWLHFVMGNCYGQAVRNEETVLLLTESENN